MVLSGCGPRRPPAAARSFASSSASTSASEASATRPRQIAGLGRITGIIHRDDGFVYGPKELVGATVVVTPAGGGTSMSAVTDERGFYTIVNVPPGDYVATFHYGESSAESSVHVVRLCDFATVRCVLRSPTGPAGSWDAHAPK